MKKFCFVICLLACNLAVLAQQVYPYRKSGNSCQMESFVETRSRVRVALGADSKTLYLTLFDLMDYDYRPNVGDVVKLLDKKTLVTIGSLNVKLRLAGGRIINFDNVTVADDLPAELQGGTAARVFITLDFEKATRCGDIDLNAVENDLKRNVLKTCFTTEDIKQVVIQGKSFSMDGITTAATLNAMYDSLAGTEHASTPSTAPVPSHTRPRPEPEPEPEPETPESLADVTYIATEHNVMQQGVKGMNVVFSANIRKMRNRPVVACAYFYFENGQMLQDYNGNFYASDTGGVSAYIHLRPAYDDTVYNRVRIFIPYDELHLGRGRHDLKVYVAIFDLNSSQELGNSEFSHFWMQR